MAHLLMLESWVGGTGRIFPPAIVAQGHRYTFVTRNRSHYLDARTREIHPVIEHARHVLTTETNDVPALIDFLRAQHAILGFDGVVTICDYYIDTVAEVAAALGLPQGFSSNVAAERRKHLVREAIDRAGLPNPRFGIARSWPEAVSVATAIGYPLILKPSDLASSAFVRLVRDDNELRGAFDALAGFTRNFRDQTREPLWLLEEYMDGDEVSVEAVTFAGETTILGITDKSVTGFPHFIEDGHMFPADLDEARAGETMGLVRDVLSAVGHDHGISHTEVKLTAAGPRIVEINPRPGGNYIAELVERVTGVDLLTVQIDLALGRRPDLTRHHRRAVSAAIRFIVPPHGGRIEAIDHLHMLDDDPAIVRHAVPPIAEFEVPTAIDNGCYLGHVVAVDPVGHGARRLADAALARLDLRYARETIR